MDMTTSHLTQEDMDELFPELNKEQQEKMKENIAMFREFFFECIKKKMEYNDLGDLE